MDDGNNDVASPVDDSYDRSVLYFGRCFRKSREVLLLLRPPSVLVVVVVVVVDDKDLAEDAVLLR